MGLAIWLSASGGVILWGVSEPLLERLAQIRGLVPMVGAGWGVTMTILAHLPGDIMAWSAGLTILANLLGAVVLYGVGYWTWKNPVSPAFAVGVAYFAAPTLWIKATSPAESLAHLLTALALAAVLRGAVPLLGLFLILVALLSASKAVMLLPLLAHLAFRRQAAYGVVIPALALLGAGCLLIPLSGGYRLEPGLSGWSYLSLAPLLLSLTRGPARAARGGIYVSLLLGSLLTGEAELASALAWGDLAFLALSALQSPETPERLSGPRVRLAWLFTAVASLVFIAVVLPGEQYLNRRILIPAQKARVPFSELWRFFSLDRHARRVAQEPWREAVPFAGMTARDFEVALELPEQTEAQGFCPVTWGQMEESRQVALLYALISDRPLRGWDTPRSLAGPLLLCKWRQQNLIEQGPLLVIRENGDARVAQPAPPLPATPSELDLRRIMVLPYRAQAVSRQPGGGYRWTSAGGEFTTVFHDSQVEVMLGSEPGEIRIVSLHPSHAVRHLEVPEFQATLSQLPEAALPSRSLVRLKLRLENSGELAISSEMLARWLLQVPGGTSFSQRASKDFLLFPGEATELEFALSTPEAEGQLWLKASAFTPSGQQILIEVEQETPLRTWRRTPPVGTWVEEP